MSTIREIASVAEWEQALDHYASPSTLIIVYFHAPRSAPGAKIASPLSTLASEYDASNLADINWFSINVEDLPNIGEVYNVSRVPCIILLRNGRPIETIEGSDIKEVRVAIEKDSQESSSAAPANIPRTPLGTSSHLTDASGASEEPGPENLRRD